MECAHKAIATDRLHDRQFRRNVSPRTAAGSAVSQRALATQVPQILNRDARRPARKRAARNVANVSPILPV